MHFEIKLFSCLFASFILVPITMLVLAVKVFLPYHRASLYLLFPGTVFFSFLVAKRDHFLEVCLLRGFVDHLLILYWNLMTFFWCFFLYRFLLLYLTLHTECLEEERICFLTVMKYLPRWMYIFTAYYELPLLGPVFRWLPSQTIY